MPRTPINYNKTIIYKIAKYNEEDPLNIYIGHTTDFPNRKSDHKRFCNNPDTNKYNYKIYQYIRANGGWECFNMNEIEKYPCIDANEARAREEHIRKELGATLNSIRAYRTEEEKQECNKIYKDINNEKSKEYRRMYKETNSEKLNEEQQLKKEKRKEYKRINYENNKEKYKENNRLYKENNKEKQKEYQRIYNGTPKDNGGSSVPLNLNP